MNSPSLGGTAVSDAFCCAETQAAAEHNAATRTTAFQIPDCVFTPSSQSSAFLFRSARARGERESQQGVLFEFMRLGRARRGARAGRAFHGTRLNVRKIRPNARQDV